MTRYPRSPLVAVLCSAVSPGLGHLYLGRVVPGISFAGGNAVLGSLGVLATLTASPMRELSILAMAATALWAAATIDTWRTARSEEGAWVPRDYNRWYVYALLVALALCTTASWAAAVRANVAQVFQVESGSMAPTISPGARVLVNELAYRSGPVRRGDIVVFVNPNQRYQRYVKRVVALPGDLVEVHGKDLFINGIRLEHDSSESSDGRQLWEKNGDARYPIEVPPNPTDANPPTTTPASRVPQGNCFVMGDRRSQAVDSRNFGPLPLADIVGRVDRIL